PLVCSIRLLLACLALLGFFLCYAQRNGLSVSIVCMVDPDADNVTLSKDISSVTVPRNIPPSCHKHTASQVLLWPKQTRGVILGSFY
ncbi:unnamed protein product, partial [Adineta steineri]